MGFLATVANDVRARLERDPLDVGALEVLASDAAPPRDLPAALDRARPAVIAELKRSSPSAGDIAPGADPEATARAYEAGGAAAISVLTETQHFHGSIDDLDRVRATVALPLLRKDFVIDRAQVLEARAHGADSVLLIAATLDDRMFATLLGAARELGMEPVVETHDEDELARVLRTDARIVGVNARDLESLEVDVPAALRRLRRIPNGRIAVLESGVATRAQVEEAVEAGAAAVLVGEALMRSPDPAGTIRQLRGAP